MTIKITRIDPLAGIPDTHKPGIISVEKFDAWESAFASLRARGIPLTPEHEREFRANDDTQFQWREWIQAPDGTYIGAVNYDVRVV